MKLFVGTSGWSYKNWTGGFYPKGSSKARLAYYSKHFDSVEVNGSFYGLLNESTVKAWLGMVPKGFVFSVKASRYITHMKRLKDCREPLDKLFASIKPFGRQCRVVLFQFPGNFKVNQERLAEFIKLLPNGYRYAFEFRNASWHKEATYNLLKEHNLAFCIFEFGDQSSPKIVTADFIYIRLHGRGQAYRGNYSDKELRGWYKWVMRQKKDAYIYFDNTDDGTHAIDNALVLKRLCESIVF
jgi:uncharacterized protein YecE (DUF72 family)